MQTWLAHKCSMDFQLRNTARHPGYADAVHIEHVRLFDLGVQTSTELNCVHKSHAILRGGFLENSYLKGSY